MGHSKWFTGFSCSRRRGVAVIAAGPEHLAEALADEYLELKQSGTM